MTMSMLVRTTLLATLFVIKRSPNLATANMISGFLSWRLNRVIGHVGTGGSAGTFHSPCFSTEHAEGAPAHSPNFLKNNYMAVGPALDYGLYVILDFTDRQWLS